MRVYKTQYGTSHNICYVSFGFFSSSQGKRFHRAHKPFMSWLAGRRSRRDCPDKYVPVQSNQGFAELPEYFAAASSDVRVSRNHDLRFDIDEANFVYHNTISQADNVIVTFRFSCNMRVQQDIQEQTLFHLFIKTDGKFVPRRQKSRIKLDCLINILLPGLTFQRS